MSESRIRRLSFEVRKYDPALYVDWINDRICVLRRTKRVESYEVDGETIINYADSPHFVFALTDTWQTTGNPVDWGIEPIMSRIKEHDLWNNPGQIEDLLKKTEQHKEGLARDRHNMIESFAIDYRREFQRQHNDVNTANLKKTDRRWADDKKINRSN